MSNKFLFLLVLSMASGNLAYAFPEMVRYKYVNCTSCHVSPAGGGALTLYGREMSRELLSMFQGEEEGRDRYFAHGLLHPENTPSWIRAMGGDVRAVQFHQETNRVIEGRFIPMQAELEAVLQLPDDPRLSASATFGIVRKGPKEMGSDFRQFYLLGQLSEELSIRGGKFRPVFGINSPEHTWFYRRDVGLGEGTESPSLESAWLNPDWNLYSTAVFPRQDSRGPSHETAITQSLERVFFDTHKVGASWWLGKTDASSRRMVSLHGILGFTPQITLLAEWDLLWTQALAPSAPLTRGETGFFKLDYELTRGLHLFAVHENSRSDFSAESSGKLARGAGVTWFPRPHFEFELLAEKRRIKAEGGSWSNYAFLMGHYYF